MCVVWDGPGFSGLRVVIWTHLRFLPLGHMRCLMIFETANCSSRRHTVGCYGNKSAVFFWEVFTWLISNFQLHALLPPFPNFQLCIVKLILPPQIIMMSEFRSHLCTWCAVLLSFFRGKHFIEYACIHKRHELNGSSLTLQTWMSELVSNSDPPPSLLGSRLDKWTSPRAQKNEQAASVTPIEAHSLVKIIELYKLV